MVEKTRWRRVKFSVGLEGLGSLLIVEKVVKKLPSNFVDCKIFISIGVNLLVNFLVNLQ